MAVQQGRHGYVTINGTTYPALSVSSGAPRNLVTGLPIGNTWATNFAEGLQTGRFTVRFLARIKATEVLSTTFWNYWLSRPFAGGFDDTAGLTIVHSTGRRTRTYANAKAESLVITVAKGAVVGITGVFVSPAPPTRGDVTPATYANQVDNSGPLMFDAVTFGGITGGVYGFELTYTNNHQPDGPLDGTKYLSAYNAGGIACGASFTFPEHLAAQEPFADAANLTVTIAGGATRTLSLTGVVANNPTDVDHDLGQIYQPYRCLVLGTASVAPLVVS